MWALRAQTDKQEYALLMRRLLESTPNLHLREGQAVGLDLGPNDEVGLRNLGFGCSLGFGCVLGSDPRLQLRERQAVGLGLRPKDEVGLRSPGFGCALE